MQTQEDKLYTQGNSTLKSIDNLKNLQTKLFDNSDYIASGLSAMCMVIFSLLSVKEGEITFALPTTILQWLLMVFYVILPVVCGMMINTSLRNKGFKLGFEVPSIAKLKEEYENLLPEKEEIIISWEQFKKQEAVKDAIFKTLIGIITGILGISATLTSSIQSLVSLFVQLFLWTGFGFSALSKSYNFVTQKQILWYRREINKIKSLKEVSNQ